MITIVNILAFSAFIVLFGYTAYKIWRGWQSIRKRRELRRRLDELAQETQRLGLYDDE